MSSQIINFGLGCFFALSVKNVIESVSICIKRRNKLNCVQSVISICEANMTLLFFSRGYKINCLLEERVGLALYYIFQTGNVCILTLRFVALLGDKYKLIVKRLSLFLYLGGMISNMLSRILFKGPYILCISTIDPDINAVSKVFFSLLYLLLLCSLLFPYLENKRLFGIQTPQTDKIVQFALLKIMGCIFAHIIVVVYLFFNIRGYTRLFFAFKNYSAVIASSLSLKRILDRE